MESSFALAYASGYYFGVLVIILVAIVGKWIRSSRRKTNGSEK